jgi:hypothetical protein
MPITGGGAEDPEYAAHTVVGHDALQRRGGDDVRHDHRRAFHHQQGEREEPGCG